MDAYEPFLEAALAAAREAGEMLRNNLGADHGIGFKGAVDLVTVFDERSQDMIFRRLSEAFPDHSFLAEEGLSREGKSGFRWIFDPLDGTTNYTHAFPVFGVSIALEHKGKIILGVVYDPMRKEMFHAVRDHGAFLNGIEIKVSKVADLGKALLATGFPYDVRTSRSNNVREFNRFVVRAQAVRRCGSAALDLCCVACGRFDGFWELKLKPWDIAAGVLMVEEAGGKVSDFDGRPLDLFGRTTLASNGLIHEEMKAVMKTSRRSGGGNDGGREEEA